MPLCAQPLFSGWYAPAAVARSGRCGRCGLTAVGRGQLSWRTDTEPIYRNHPPLAATGCGGVVFVCLEGGEGGGVRLGAESCVVGEFFLVQAGVFVLM